MLRAVAFLAAFLTLIPGSALTAATPVPATPKAFTNKQLATHLAVFAAANFVQIMYDAHKAQAAASKDVAAPAQDTTKKPVVKTPTGPQPKLTMKQRLAALWSATRSGTASALASLKTGAKATGRTLSLLGKSESYKNYARDITHIWETEPTRGLTKKQRPQKYVQQVLGRTGTFLKDKKILTATLAAQIVLGAAYTKNRHDKIVADAAAAATAAKVAEAARLKALADAENARLDGQAFFKQADGKIVKMTVREGEKLANAKKATDDDVAAYKKANDRTFRTTVHVVKAAKRFKKLGAITRAKVAATKAEEAKRAATAAEDEANRKRLSGLTIKDDTQARTKATQKNVPPKHLTLDDLSKAEQEEKRRGITKPTPPIPPRGAPSPKTDDLRGDSVPPVDPHLDLSGADDEGDGRRSTSPLPCRTPSDSGEEDDDAPQDSVPFTGKGHVETDGDEGDNALDVHGDGNGRRSTSPAPHVDPSGSDDEGEEDGDDDGRRSPSPVPLRAPSGPSVPHTDRIFTAQEAAALKLLAGPVEEDASGAPGQPAASTKRHIVVPITAANRLLRKGAVGDAAYPPKQPGLVTNGASAPSDELFESEKTQKQDGTTPQPTNAQRLVATFQGMPVIGSWFGKPPTNGTLAVIHNIPTAAAATDHLNEEHEPANDGDDVLGTVPAPAPAPTPVPVLTASSEPADHGHHDDLDDAPATAEHTAVSAAGVPPMYDPAATVGATGSTKPKRARYVTDKPATKDVVDPAQAETGRKEYKKLEKRYTAERNGDGTVTGDEEFDSIQALTRQTGVAAHTIEHAAVTATEATPPAPGLGFVTAEEPVAAPTILATAQTPETAPQFVGILPFEEAQKYPHLVPDGTLCYAKQADESYTWFISNYDKLTGTNDFPNITAQNISHEVLNTAASLEPGVGFFEEANGNLQRLQGKRSTKAAVPQSSPYFAVLKARLNLAKAVKEEEESRPAWKKLGHMVWGKLPFTS